jgi:hypothetical protein
MAALIALVAIGLFAAGAVAGIVGVVSVAIRREERKFTLTSAAPDNVTRAGRLLNGVYVRAPLRTAPPLPTGRRRLSNPPACQHGISGTKSSGWPQQREHRPLPGAAQREFAAGPGRLNRPQQPHLQHRIPANHRPGPGDHHPSSRRPAGTRQRRRHDLTSGA